jgi:hypothetical protein
MKDWRFWLMPKRLFLRSLCGSLFLVLSTLLAQAQTAAPRFELGAHLTHLRFDDSEQATGGGGRVTFNLTNALALESEVDLFPAGSRRFGGRKTLALFGAKFGKRGARFGVFGKARPGLAHFSALKPVFPCVPSPECRVPVLTAQTRFALDVGGALEFYPGRRFVLRVDAGDTVIAFGNGDRPFTNAKHNLQLSIGAGYRFGHR